MNDDQHATYQVYLRTLADAMQLRDWKIILQREYPPERDCWAHIEVCRQHNTAWIRVAWPEFFDTRTPDERRNDLTHELIHVHLDRPDQMMCDLAEMFPDNTATQFAKERHKVEVEFATESLARIIAPFMPLPPTSSEGEQCANN